VFIFSLPGAQVWWANLGEVLFSEDLATFAKQSLNTAMRGGPGELR
jgi:hypothetical protein